jgi:hypothetical protein
MRDHHCLNFTFIFVWGGLFGHELSKFKDILIQNMLNCNKDNDKTTIKYHETVTIKRTTNKQWLDGKTGSLILYLISLKVKKKGPFLWVTVIYNLSSDKYCIIQLIPL